MEPVKREAIEAIFKHQGWWDEYELVVLVRRLLSERDALARRVAELEGALGAVEWRGHRGHCPMCDGWEAEKGRGATPGKHAKTCELAKLLAAGGDRG
jgi:hypothetical protein